MCIDKNRCNEKLFFQKSHFFGLRKIISRKTRFFYSKPLKIWNFGKNQKVSSWCDDLKKNRTNLKKVIFSAYGKLLAEKHFFFKSKPLKIWNFGKNEKFRLDVTILKNKKKSKKVIFSAYRKLSAEKRVFSNLNRWVYDVFSGFLKSTLYSFTIMSILMYS